MEEIREQLPRYQQLRTILTTLHLSLRDELPPYAVVETARVLGIYNRDGTIYFESDIAMSLLIDYSIYDFQWDGQTVIERRLARTTGEDTDERLLLEAMARTAYSVFAIIDVVPGYGMKAHDIVKEGKVLIMDVGLSSEALKNMVLACRTICPAGCAFSMIPGRVAGLGCIDADTCTAEIPDLLAPAVKSALSEGNTQDRSGLTAAIIRACLETKM